MWRNHPNADRSKTGKSMAKCNESFETVAVFCKIYEEFLREQTEYVMR